MASSFFLLILAAAIVIVTILCTILFMVYKKFKSKPQNEAIPSSSSSPSSSSPYNPSFTWTAHVYSSFSSVDIPISFRSHIFRELRRKGFDPLTDNEIERCVSVGPDLSNAIRGSRIVLVMLSRNYASSLWCLNELVEIMNCKEEMGQRVVTLFYELDSDDVKNQTGDFGKAFRETCKGKTKEDTERWRQALAEISATVDYHSNDWDNEAAMVEKITTGISNKLTNTSGPSGFEGLVGMEAHIKMMEQNLCLDSDEVKMIGIWGPPGIGKTTIAKILFSKHSHQFQLSVFMENIKERERIWHNEYNAKLKLQNQLLSQLLNRNYTDDTLHLRVLAQKELKDKKVLVVFDDVDSLQQLDALVIETLWFGHGSRIIVTTQEPRLLKAQGIKHLYKVNYPLPDEALQIFFMYTFGQKFPSDIFPMVSQEVTTLSGRHPLGLRLIGTYLRGVFKKDWELAEMRTHLDGDIGSIIKFTYHLLRGEDKELSHHHISCLCDRELNEIMEVYLTTGLAEKRRDKSITNRYLNEDIYTSERASKGISSGLLHSIDIYCPDTLQYSFGSHLSKDFRRKGFYAFVNCNETLDVIEGASASVVVFSDSCYYSTLYLDNLVRVLQCQRKTGQLVVPVFYGIGISDLGVQTYKSADQIREWSTALQELGELPCYQFREEGSECELVEVIVKDTYEKIFPTERIGINLRLLKIEQLLCKQPWGIRHIGIWGMPGIGKTTLAKAVFDQISGRYEASCFIKQFDKVFHEKGRHRLMEEHFGKILKDLPRACSSITRPSLLREISSKKRTLVVLDDVHNPLVAESFLKGFHWFGPGSLIIITSRDKNVFRFCQINHVYEAQSLDENDALQLFSQCAFGEGISEQDIRKLSKEVTDYANGNPLALSFYGKELKGKKLSEMETTFLKLKLRTPYKIHDLYKSSYEALNDSDKNIFLDIACFFNGENVEYVMQLLEGCGFFPHAGIDVLVEKCLVTLSENRVHMQKLVQDFGREVINRETIHIERRRRLWEPWTVKFLLEDNKHRENKDPNATYKRALGTEGIEGIYLDTLNLKFDVNPHAFDNMYNLRILKIYCSRNKKHCQLRLPKGLKSLPYELRLLHWENYPLRSLPQDFEPCHLFELNMPNSQLKKLWGGTKNLDKLKTVRLCHSQQLTEIGDLCKAKNIKLIDLQGCIKLQSFPATSQMQHLQIVDLTGCREIKSFPEVSPNIEELYLEGTSIKELPISIGNAINLEILDVSYCGLVELPSFEKAINLKKLHCYGCSDLVQLHGSIGNAINLEILDLNYCSSLMELPSSFGNLINLKELHLIACSSLVKLPFAFGNAFNLKELYFNECTGLVKLPASFGNAINLKILHLCHCSSLMELPSSFGNAVNLEILKITYCTSLVELPTSFGNLIALTELYLKGCSRLIELPVSFGKAINLKKLDLSCCSSLVELPSSFGNAIDLKMLDLSNCSSLVELPSSFENLINLEELYLIECSSLMKLPPSYGNAINLKKLSLKGCTSLIELPASFKDAKNLEI